MCRLLYLNQTINRYFFHGVRIILDCREKNRNSNTKKNTTTNHDTMNYLLTYIHKSTIKHLYNISDANCSSWINTGNKDN